MHIMAFEIEAFKKPGLEKSNPFFYEIRRLTIYKIMMRKVFIWLVTSSPGYIGKQY